MSKTGMPPQNVLAVSADEQILSTLRSNLAGEIKLLETSGREAALTAIQDHDCSLLILDLENPESDGYALAREVLSVPESGTLQILFLTTEAFRDERLPEEYAEATIDCFPKSYPQKILTGKIRTLLKLDRSNRAHQHSPAQNAPENNPSGEEFEQPFLKSLMELLPLSVYFKNLESRFVHSNRTHIEHMGVQSEKELLGKSDFDFFPEEAARIRYEQEQEVIRTGKPIQREEYGRDEWMLTIKAPWRTASGAIKGTYGFSLSITEKKDALLQIESMFRTVPAGIGLISNSPSRIIMEANDHLCAMLGYSADELVGKNTMMLYPTPEEYIRLGQLKSKQLNDDLGPIEGVWRRKDGTLIDVLLNSTWVDLNDPSKGTTFVAQDISEKKRNAAGAGRIPPFTPDDSGYHSGSGLLERR